MANLNFMEVIALLPFIAVIPGQLMNSNGGGSPGRVGKGKVQGSTSVKGASR